MADKITTMRLRESVKIKFRKKFREYPRETDEEILLKLIKKEVNKNGK